MVSVEAQPRNSRLSSCCRVCVWFRGGLTQPPVRKPSWSYCNVFRVCGISLRTILQSYVQGEWGDGGSSPEDGGGTHISPRWPPGRPGRSVDWRVDTKDPRTQSRVFYSPRCLNPALFVARALAPRASGVCSAEKQHICAQEALRPAVWSATSQDLSMNFVISLRSELCLPIAVQVSRAMRTLPRVLGARARTVGRLPQRSAKFVAAIQTPVVTPVFRTLRMSAAGQSVPAPIALVAALRAS